MDKLSKAGLIVFLVLVLLSTGISLGILKGKAIKEAEYQAKYKSLQNEIEELNDKHRDEEKSYARVIQSLEDKLKRNQDDYNVSINGLSNANADLLRKLDARESHYQRLLKDMQEAGASECAGYIRSTRDLDRNLVEGVNVVRELRAASTRANKDITTLIGIIKADRLLLAD